MTSHTTIPGDGLTDTEARVLLPRYLSGDVDATERTLVDHWIARAPEHRREIEILRAAWASVPNLPAHVSERGTAVWARVTSQLTGIHNGRRGVRPPWAIGAIAAAAVVMMLALVWHTSSHAPQAFREFAVAAGSRSTITLRDGTRIALGPATQLRVPADFGATNRTVELTGEGLFAVVHDDQHPFAVVANGITTQDVGTQFDIRAYDDDPDVRVVVVEGAVAVALVGAGRGTARGLGDSRPRPSLPTMMLHAGDMETIDGPRTNVVHNAHLASLVAWTQGGLAFEDTPFGQAVRDIARTYSVTVTVADSALLQRPVTASFTDQPLTLVLDELTRAVGARYERLGKTIVIRNGTTTTRTNHPGVPVPLTTAQASDTRP